MKKLFIIKFLIIAAIFASCGEEQIFPTPQPTPQPQQPVNVPDSVKITNDDFIKFAYPEWVIDDDTLIYSLICEKEFEQPVLEIQYEVWGTYYFYYFSEFEDSLHFYYRNNSN